MQLTKEQQNIIASTGNIKINAVAGSGKTTTIIEYAKARPSDSKILYLAFNKSVKLEAQKRFAEKGLDNVQVETAHSLAYKYVVPRHHYKIKTQDYKTPEVVEILGLQVAGEKHDVYVIANHIQKFVAYFCNSDKERVSDLNYLDMVIEAEAKDFVLTHYDYIELQTRLFLGKMNKGEIDITHDFYLKKFQLSNPKLYFDYILFDEGQDASPAMLDIFFKQLATKVIVGDTHQQIYGWRFAVNSLEKADFKIYHLSTSFRFGQEIANLAVEILKRKRHLGEHQPVVITGKGSSKAVKVKAILARTNLGLLVKAIEYTTQKKDIGHIYFEGNINSYMYADEGASLYDILNLRNLNKKMIKDSLIKGMQDMEELEDYAEKTEDAQLGMMIEIVKEYGNKIPGILKTIKEKHVENNEREKAEVIFSTIHRCKGLEYDTIQIVDDFLTEEKLEKLKAASEKEPINLARLQEEINLLYVAVTRAKNIVNIPKTLMPEGFPASLRIHVSSPKAKEEGKDGKKTGPPEAKKMPKTGGPKAKIYPFDGQKTQHNGLYQPWTRELDLELGDLFEEGASIDQMAHHFGRTKGAIKARMIKLGMMEEE